MNTQEKADDYNERAKKQIRTKAFQKGVEETEATYKAQIRDLKKENKALKTELDAVKLELTKLKKKFKVE
jgi:predicted RNase H-like nuclease (RuvC/YqgF family)